jgi:hypothetical protein
MTAGNLSRSAIAMALLAGCGNKVQADAHIDGDELVVDVTTSPGATVYVDLYRGKPGEPLRGTPALKWSVDAPADGHLVMKQDLGATQAGSYVVDVSSVTYRPRPFKSSVADRQVAITVPKRPFLVFQSCKDEVGGHDVKMKSTLRGAQEGATCDLDDDFTIEVALVGAEGEDFTIGDASFTVDEDGRAKTQVSLARWFGTLRVASVANSAANPAVAKPEPSFGPFELPVEMKVAGSTLAAKLTLEPTDSLFLADEARRWAILAATGALPPKKTNGTGALVVLGDDVGSLHFVGKPETLDDVRYVATREVIRTETVGKCGPYSGGSSSYLDIERSDYRVTIFDRSGKEFTKREFRGVVTECPDSFMSYEGEGELVFPARPRTADILSWVASVTK